MKPLKNKPFERDRKVDNVFKEKQIRRHAISLFVSSGVRYAFNIIMEEI